jgi:hypothetical protein
MELNKKKSTKSIQAYIVLSRQRILFIVIAQPSAFFARPQHANK